MFIRQGGIVKENEEVLQVVPGDCVTIVTRRGRYTAGSVILTPGAWAAKILRPLGIDPPLKVRCGSRQASSLVKIEDSRTSHLITAGDLSHEPCPT